MDQNGPRESLDAYLAHIHNVIEKRDFASDEASILAPFDTEYISEVKQLAEDIENPKLKYIVVIGIGGSSLGAKALYSALYEEGKTKEIVWLESVDENNIFRIEKIVEGMESKDECVLIIISKSGKTTETLVNASKVLSVLEEKFNNISDRVIVISDNETPLIKWAEDYHAHTLFIREKIGGRFSVFSPVGLFPLILAGIDIDNIILGAQNAINDSSNNFPQESALAIFDSYKKGHVIHNMFLFNPRLENLGKWYRQLSAESLGKEKDIHNNVVRIDLTPTVAIGSDDLHSMGQLYLSGKDNEITTFVSNENNDSISIPKSSILGPIQYVERKTFCDVKKAILSGTTGAYDEDNLPYFKVSLDGDLAYELGYFMQSLMIQIMLLAHLFEINAFNQPEVEKYKKITRQILEQ